MRSIAAAIHGLATGTFEEVAIHEIILMRMNVDVLGFATWQVHPDFVVIFAEPQCPRLTDVDEPVDGGNEPTSTNDISQCDRHEVLQEIKYSDRAAVLKGGQWNDHHVGN